MNRKNLAARRERAARVGRKNAERHRWTIQTLIRKHGGLCHLCNKPVEMHDEHSPTYATIDHIVPLSRGGSENLSNIALAHRGCNASKGNCL